MKEFTLKKSQLTGIVSANQTRTFAEEIDLLQEKGEDIQWLFSSLRSHPKNGISSEAACLE